MDHNALLLLGLLRTQSQHGYQLFDFIERNLSRITNLKKPTAYAMLDRFYKDGLVDVRVEQEGNRPPRKVFELTESGQTRFLELLQETLSNVAVQNTTGDVGLMFLDQLQPLEQRSCLQKRLSELQVRVNALERVPDHAHGSSVNFAIQHQLTLLRADRDWHAQLIAQLE
jgi:DNA-binding PadR family transcriptional regulator